MIPPALGAAAWRGAKVVATPGTVADDLSKSPANERSCPEDRIDRKQQGRGPIRDDDQAVMRRERAAVAREAQIGMDEAVFLENKAQVLLDRERVARHASVPDGIGTKSVFAIKGPP